MKYWQTVLIPTLILFISTSFQKELISWRNLEEGLEYTSISLPHKSIAGDSKVDILRINPNKFSLELICAEEKKSESKKINEWAKEHHLIAAINAGMFKLEGNYKTSTGYMKNYSYINNPFMTSSYKAVLAFNPKDTALPKAQIIDLKCQNWSVLKDQYNSFSQGIRMVDCDGKNTWQLQEKKWSMVLIGQDAQGKILFIFCRSPYRVHDMIKQLLVLPVGIKRLMYLEGGPEASFYLNHPSLAIEKCGSYETGFNENDNNKEYWNIPNVIGLKRIR